LEAGSADERGIYVYTLNVAVDKSPDHAPQVLQALAVPGTDGITLVENWSALEPAQGVFEWDPPTPPGQSLFDQWISTAVASGKKVNLAIRVGEFTPCWLFQGGCPAGYTGGYAGAARWSFESAPHQGETRGCEEVDVALPWDPVFLHEWDVMLAAVARHLQDTGAYDAVSLVRLTGINRTTDELRLPEEILSTSFSPPGPCTTNSITTWLAAGYRPARLLQAWDSITDSFAAHFPGKTFNVPIIPDDTGQGQFPFPEIGDDGCVYTQVVRPGPAWSVPPAIPGDTCTNAADVPDQNRPLLELASRKFPGRLVVEFENLDTRNPASPTVVDAALDLGTMTGFMTNNYLAAQGGIGAACSGGFVLPQRCPDSSAYLALLDIGIYPQVPVWNGQPFDRSTSLRSQYIEVLAPDVIPPECSPATQPACGYPSAIAQAHARLTDDAPPTIRVVASPATLWPPTGQLVPVTISGTITDDLSGVDRSTAAFAVHDQDGVIEPRGPVVVDAQGAFSFVVALEARRSGTEADGRHYRITVSARDVAGNPGSASATVVVPHDRQD
jgi:hypothetical protein